LAGVLLHSPLAMPGGSQQLFEAEHASTGALQISPGSLQAPPWLAQTPYSAPTGLLQTFAFGLGIEQQSDSSLQSSPTGWQPDGLWQTFFPFSAPPVPHAREQQASHVSALVQVRPEIAQPPAPVPSAGPQRPFAWPTSFTQLPLQHWMFEKQMSLACWHEETDAQVPARQSPEQQSVGNVQPLPVVWHVPPPTDAHLPVTLLHEPLQHSVPEVQFSATGLSFLQAVAEHRPLTQKPEQHSAASAQTPAALHAPPSGALHTFGEGIPHVPPFGQGEEPTPHLITLPHPSGTKPQVRPAHAATGSAGVQTLPPPQTLGVPPPPHTSGAWQVPHGAVRPPQPSATWPQFLPRS
jgi:hypothetical protein